MIDCKLFVQKYFPDASLQKIKDINGFLENLELIIGDGNAKELLANENFLCRTFFLRRTNNISTPQYQKTKEFLRAVLDYYELTTSIPTHETVLASQEIISYFRDLDDALDFVDKVGYLNSPNYKKDVDLMHIKSIVVLAWYGLSQKSICSMPKGNIEALQNGTYVLHSPFSPQKDILISKRAYDILEIMQGLDGYTSISDQRYFHFVGYHNSLLRPTKITRNGVDEKFICQIILRFNRLNPTNKCLSIKTLRKNALFVEIHNDITDKPLINKIIEHMDCTRKIAHGYKPQYLQWVKLFF